MSQRDKNVDKVVHSNKKRKASLKPVKKAKYKDNYNYDEG